MSDKKITQKSTQPTSSYIESAQLTSTYNVGNAGASVQPTTNTIPATGSNNSCPLPANKK